MEHTLIYTIIGSIVVAFIMGMIAKQLKLPAIFGYLLAGVAIGPNTPGFVADVSLANQLAEIGITLLMFGVGLHFSLRDLMQSRKIAIPGAVIQMLVATIIGAFVAAAYGYGTDDVIIFGLSLSVASTIVLIRSLEQLNLLGSEGGKIAISWLIVEDIAMVLALVIIPVLAEIEADEKAITTSMVLSILLGVILKIGGFIAFMVVVARRFLPWLLKRIEMFDSEEMNTLGSLAIALGFAVIAYVVFNASLALGAFLAGVMLNESDIGKKSADHSTQIRDAFSVLFFVSVGMLFDPRTLISQPVAVLLTFLTIVVAKSLTVLVIARFFKLSKQASYQIAIGLAQIGEFSFILGALALSEGLIPQELYNLILAGAMLSIVVNPFLFRFYKDKMIIA